MRRELRVWRAQALLIPDPTLRRVALEALAKRANIEGAAAFATFVPAQRRADVVRATVAFQSAYNYLDLLAEQPREQAVRNSRALHAALPAALAAPPTAAGATPPAARRRRESWYAHLDSADDAGYLPAMVQVCRDALRALPSYEAARPAALRAAERVARFQSFNCGKREGDREGLRRLGLASTPAHSGLWWWEIAAAAGSSLGAYAMIAAAARPGLKAADLDAIERLYFPWLSALHSLLDQLVDLDEDARTGQYNLLRCYASPEQAARRLGRITAEALARARSLTGRKEAARHALIAAAMAAMYLSAPASREPRALGVRKAVLRELGLPASLSIAVFELTGRGG